MITHINLGSNNLEAAEAFYNELLSLFGGKQTFKSERTVYFTLGEGNGANLAINTPFNGNPATTGNGSMVALGAVDTNQVDAVYRKALELGGRCEGEPGERLGGAMYAAYFRDLDGNKLAVFCQPGH